MRYARLFGHTLRENPADVQIPSLQTLARAGYIRAGTDGSFHLMPMGVKMMERLKEAFWKPCSDADMQVIDINDNSVIPTELGELLRTEVHSHRQLPVSLALRGRFQHATARSRYGLFEGRAPEMLHLVTLARQSAGEVGPLSLIRESWQKSLTEMGLPVRVAQSGGARAWRGQDEGAQSLVCLTPFGADVFFSCSSCGSLVHSLAARPAKRDGLKETPAPIEKVHTPACKTIQELAAFLHVEENQTAKAVFLVASGINYEERGEAPRDTFVFAVIRGDLDIHEGKLARLLGGANLRPAAEEEIRAVGAVPGFASPVLLRPAGENALPVRIIVDESINEASNLVAGANETDMHLRNVNYDRDFQADLIGDIAAAHAGDACSHCGADLEEETGVELVWFSSWKQAALPCDVQGENGENLPLTMDLVSLGWERLFAGLAEFNRDEQGLVLPAAAAPFQVHLIVLNDKKDPAAVEMAESLYKELSEAGVDVLFDDSDERPGVKFMDADLMGIPLRLTVSARSLAAGGIEVKERRKTEKEVKPWKEVLRVCLQTREETCEF